MANGGDGTIELNVDLNIGPAKKSAGDLNATISKALNSNSTKMQNLGLQLQKATDKLNKYNSQLKQMETTKVPTEAFSQLQTRLDAVQSKISSVTAELEKMEDEGTSQLPSNQYSQLQTELDGLIEKFTELHTRYQELKSEGYTPQTSNEMLELGQELITINARIQEVQTAIDNLNQTEKYVENPEYGEKIAQLEQLKTEYTDIAAKIQEIKNSGTDTITEAQVNPEKYNQIATNAQQANINVNRLSNSIYAATTGTNRLSNSWKSFGNNSTSIISRISNYLKTKLSGSIKSTESTSNKSFKSMLTTVLKYGFGIRSIYFLFNKIRNTISTGLTEMSEQFSDVSDDVYTLKNSWSGFKASLVSAFQPIFSYVVPALTTLINYLTSAMNGLANFFAMLTGQSYYYKAVKGNESAASSIDDVADSAEAANEELADYDDLMVISQDTSSSSSSDSDSDSGSAWNWEKVSTESTTLTEKLSDIWDVFKSAWETKGQDVIDAAKYAFESLKSVALTVAETFYEVFTDGYGYEWLVSCLGVLEQVLLTIGDIANAFKTAWENDGNGYNLIASFFTMLTKINNLLIAIQVSFRNAWNDGTGVAIFTNILQIITNIQTTVGNIAAQLTKAWTTAEVGDRIMSTILGTINDILTFINDITAANAEWAAELDFYPLLESIESVLGSVRGIIQTILGIAKSLYENYILPLSEKIIESYLPEFLEQCSQAIDNIKSGLDKIDFDAIFSVLEKITEAIIEMGLDNVKFDVEMLGIAWDSLTSIIADVQTLLSDLADIFSEITGIDFEGEGWETFKTFLSWIAVHGNLANQTLTFIAGALSVLKEKIHALTTFVESHKDTITSMGSDIVDGILEGFKTGIKNMVFPGSLLFDWIVDNIKELFGIASPAKKMYTYGEDILKGIVQGFKNAFTNITSAISELKDKIVSKIKDKFGDIIDKAKEAIGEFSITSLLGLEDSAVIDVITNITSNFLGGLLSLADFETFENVWGDIKNAFKNITATITAKLSGVFSKLTDVSDLKEKFSDLKDAWKDKAAELKAELGGKIKEATDLDDLKEKFSNLWDTWKDKAATMKATVSGAISKITDLDTWKSKMYNLRNTWMDKAADFKATLSGKIKEITNLDTWKTTMSNLRGEWADKKAAFSATFDTTQSVLDTWKTKISNLYSSWKSKTAEFSLKFSAAASDLKSWVNTNVISKINSAFSSVPILKSVKIPNLARGGVLDSETLLRAGEAGTEAVVPLERNLGWLDTMASMISDKLADTPIPLIANGNILPMTDAFMKSTVEVMDNSKIARTLDNIYDRLNEIEENGIHPTIPVFLDGRQVAEVVWDETEKRYRQSGTRFAF